VLYNTAPKKKKGKIFEVERIITRKKKKQVSIKVKLPEFMTYIYLYNIFINLNL
jgi:hypothetical protein